jgi:DNA-binding NtrC family response regulator
MAHVLLYEDDVFSQQFLLDLLEEGGHTGVLGRLDGGVRDQLRTATFDVVVTDLRLRTFTGFDVLTWVDEVRPGTPVIGISGAVNRAPEPGRAHAFAAFLLKPIDAATFLETIAGVVPD